MNQNTYLISEGKSGLCEKLSNFSLKRVMWKKVCITSTGNQIITITIWKWFPIFKGTSLHHSSICRFTILEYWDSYWVGLGTINTCGMVQINPPILIPPPASDRCVLWRTPWGNVSKYGFSWTPSPSVGFYELSSTGSVRHQYHRGHGFKSHSTLNFFRLYF